jgi:outer membrane protein
LQRRKNKRNKQRIISQLALCLLGMIFVSPAAFAAKQAVFQIDKTLSSKALFDAGVLIRNNDFNAAYQLLEPLESQNAGNQDYDYLFGVAAVESNNLTRGAFALERVLAENPNHLDARAEMAKAHFLLGETETSKAEFNNVLAQNPDADTKKTVEKLLTAIQKIEGTTTTFAAFLDAGLGYDTNVSSAPDLKSVTIPVGVPIFGGAVISLDAKSLQKADSFMNLTGGVSFRHPFTKQLAAFGGASVNGRFNSDQSAFDNSGIDLNLGLQYVQDKHQFSVGLQDNNFYLDSKHFRHAYGGSAQWLYNFDAYNQAGVYGQFSRLDFIDNKNNNADRKIIGINAAHAFKGDYRPAIYGSIYGGREDAKTDDKSQDVVGIRAGGQLSLTNQLQLSASVSAERRENDANNPLFLKKQQDNQYDASLGLNYSLGRNWSVKPQVSYTKSDSNIELFSYDRAVVSVNARKDFSW